MRQSGPLRDMLNCGVMTARNSQSHSKERGRQAWWHTHNTGPQEAETGKAHISSLLDSIIGSSSARLCKKTLSQHIYAHVSHMYIYVYT